MSQNLNYEIRNCFEKSINKNIKDIIILTNKDKYYDIESPAKTNSYTNKIFSLMRALNEDGISNESLGIINHGNSFKDALTKTIDNLSKQLSGKSFCYVELGPEPIKTSFIIRGLLQKGCNLCSYTSVDINPSSSSAMKECLTPLISAERIFSINQDYNLCNYNTFNSRENLTVFTMLGFQEGNEVPSKIAETFKKITEKEDIIISEMQIMSLLDSSPIYKFYNNEKMKFFSKAVFKQRFFELDSVYGFFLLPIEISNINYFVAITTETIVSEGNYFDNVVITNFCLKPYLKDLNKVREMDGNFKVLYSQTTEDETIAFQISKKIQ